MGLADRLARLNRLGPNRVVGMFAGRWVFPVAAVEHRGRKSGRLYRTPVIAFGVDDGYIISLPYGEDRDWVRNVLASGSCTIERGGRRVPLTDPRVLDRDEAVSLPAPVRAGLRVLGVKRVLRLVRIAPRSPSRDA